VAVAPVVLTAEIRWVLLRAFGPPAQVCSHRIDPARATELATDLGLVERIGARAPADLLVAELGREAARQLTAARLRAVAGVGALAELVAELAAMAASSSIPIVPLKFAGLHAGGHLLLGSRGAGDVDVLVREQDAERAAWLLGARGFQPVGMTAAEHHLPPWQDGRGRMVELHTRLPGLRVPGHARFCGFEDLESAGGLRPAPGFGDACHLLRPHPMVAHLVAHGLAHHGGADDYPVARMLADVIDVLAGDCRTLGAGAREWLDDHVGGLEAVLGLCDRLKAGDLDGLAAGAAPPEAGLLRHVLAGSLDADYRSRLVVGHLLHPLTDRGRWRKVMRMVRYSVFPSDADLAARFGLPSARLVDRRLRLVHARRLPGRMLELARAALHSARRRVGRAGEGAAP